MAYPAVFDVQRPTAQFERGQVALRILIIIVLYWLLNGVVGAAYLVLPILAAILISQKGAERYLAEANQGPVTWLRLIMGFYSYVALLTDKLPLEKPEEVVSFNVQPNGSPTVGSALMRIILAIPHAFVLGILGFIFAIVWLIAVISILINGAYPDWAFNYIRGYLRWNARVLAYMTSLVDEYPPFSFENGGAAPAPPPSETPAA